MKAILYRIREILIRLFDRDAVIINGFRFPDPGFIAKAKLPNTKLQSTDDWFEEVKDDTHNI